MTNTVRDISTFSALERRETISRVVNVLAGLKSCDFEDAKFANWNFDGLQFNLIISKLSNLERLITDEGSTAKQTGIHLMIECQKIRGRTDGAADELSVQNWGCTFFIWEDGGVEFDVKDFL